MQLLPLCSVVFITALDYLFAGCLLLRKNWSDFPESKLGCNSNQKHRVAAFGIRMSVNLFPDGYNRVKLGGIPGWYDTCQ